MEISILDNLFKEFYALRFLSQKQPEELNSLFLLYQQQQLKYTAQFKGWSPSSNEEIKLINRFITRLSESYSIMIQQRLISKSKASKFLPTIYNCLASLTQANIIQDLITAVFNECKLQLEITYRKISDTEPIFTTLNQCNTIQSIPQSSNYSSLHLQQNSTSLLLKNNTQSAQASSSTSLTFEQRKTSIPDWQVNVKANKPLNTYFNKIHPKIYDLLDNPQEEQFVYYQSREQNAEKLFSQLMQRNAHIQKSLNWALNINPMKYAIKMDRRSKRLREIQETYSPQLERKLFLKANNFFSPSKKQQCKFRNNKINNTTLKIIQSLNGSITQQSTTLSKAQTSQQLSVNKISLEFKSKSMPFNVFKRKINLEIENSTSKNRNKQQITNYIKL